MGIVVMVLGMLIVLGGFLIERASKPTPETVYESAALARLSTMPFQAYRWSYGPMIEVMLDIDDGIFRGKVTGKGETLPIAITEAFRAYDVLKAKPGTNAMNREAS